MSFTLPKQPKRSRSVYKTDLDFLDCFGRKKKLCLITEEIQYAETLPFICQNIFHNLPDLCVQEVLNKSITNDFVKIKML